MPRTFIFKRLFFNSSLVAAAALGAAGLVHCGSANDDSASEAQSVAASSDSASSRSVSFLIASDLHFGYGVDPAGDGPASSADYETVDGEDDDVETPDDDEATAAANAANPRGAIFDRNVALRAAMTSAASASGAKPLSANSISNKFAGLIVTGDLADNGQPQQWDDFANVFGYDGSGTFKLPIYETSGNHDYAWTTDKTSPYNSAHDVYDLRKIAARDGDYDSGDKRKDQIEYDPNGSGAYAWHFGDVLFVNLGVKASDVDSTTIPGPNNHFRYTDPFKSLEFLEGVLKAHASNGNPVVLSFHYPMVTSDKRMKDSERDHFFNVIKSYNIVAILHGHRHVSSQYHWCGIPVLEVSTPRNVRSDKDSTFVAVTIDGSEIHAQTVRYRQAGASTVAYDTKCDLLKKDKGDTCWIFHEKLSSIKIPSSCNTKIEDRN